MQINWLVFPAPKYDRSQIQKDLKRDDIVFIPKILQKEHTCLSFLENIEQNSIPCQYIQFSQNKQFSDKICIFFHGNAEDISKPSIFVQKIKENLQCNMLVVEYPGYSFYQGSPSAEKIENDAQTVYDYLINKGVNYQNIFVFGRSIGSGPATYLASKNKIGFLILMSAYTSIKDATKYLAGYFLSFFVKQRFQNDKNIKSIKCPIFLVHGIKDEIIPYTHSKQLVQQCISKKLGFNFPQEMTHNKFQIQNDIMDPLIEFMNKKQITVNFTNNNDFDFFINNKQDTIQIENTIFQDIQLIK